MSNVLIIGQKLAFGTLAISIVYFITNRFFWETNATKIISLILRSIAIIMGAIIFGLVLYDFWANVYPNFGVI